VLRVDFNADFRGHKPKNSLRLQGRHAGLRFSEAAAQPIHRDDAVGIDQDLDDAVVVEECAEGSQRAFERVGTSHLALGPLRVGGHGDFRVTPKPEFRHRHDE
jgi:hypothetical protein